MSRNSPKTTYLTGIVAGARPYVLASYPPLTSGGACLLLTKNPKQWLEQIQFWLKIRKKRGKDSLFYLPTFRIKTQNLKKTYKVLKLLKTNQNVLVLSTEKIFRQNLPTPRQLLQHSLVIEKGQKINLPKLIGLLLSSGYQKVGAHLYVRPIVPNTPIQNGHAHKSEHTDSPLQAPGTFAQRGGILDVFPLFVKNPYRIELFGNKVESIQTINNNRTIKQSNNKIKIPPLNIIRNPQGSILDWLHPHNIIILDKPEINLKKLKKKHNLFIFPSLPSSPKNLINFDFKNPILYPEEKKNLTKTLKPFYDQGYQIFLASKKLDTSRLPSFCHLVSKPRFNTGFQSDKEKILLLTDQEIFGPQRRRLRQKRVKADPKFLSELKPGMYVVNIDHGIGRFRGMVEKKINKHRREYFTLEYACRDKLFLPIDQAYKITRYIGRSHPPLHRLGESTWHLVKKQTQADAKKMAQELIKIQAKRETQKGFAFQKDTPLLKKLEDSFPYTETPDQEKAIWEVKEDMEAPKPMDRLICGDVGFGKTEIAVRAASGAAQNRKQTCVFAPTTILAQQHYDTFKARLKKFPVRVALLTRFQTKSRQKEILKNLSQGKIDIVIGTHRLLSADVKFDDLGLVIIDEEQRFGVRQKEKLKKMRANLDILTLSATPIPRTLQFALGHLKDLSLIETPPPGRKPIKTYVKLKNDAMIKKAISSELSRGGQVYYLYNRVETILAQAKKLRKLVPKARIDVAHGQLSEKDLAQVMHEFDQGKIDILVSTTIIENGLDLPRVNTLIVENAPRFGLSQLYQIRGRIGRGVKQGYAYLLYDTKKIAPLARKRLETLLEMQELGSGFTVAMRDLEIRGAGNVLGRKQAGRVNSLGLHLYSELLKQAIAEIKTGKKPEPILEVNIDLPLTAYLPRSFISSEKERLSYYYRLSRVNKLQEIQRLKDKIQDCYGSPPFQVKNLLKILEIKILARKARIKNIDTIRLFGIDGQPKKRIILDFATESNWEGIEKLRQKNPAWVIGENKLKIDFKDLGKNWIPKLKEALKVLAD